MLLTSDFLIQPTESSTLSKATGSAIEVSSPPPSAKRGSYITLHKAPTSRARALSNPVPSLGRQVRELGDQSGALTFNGWLQPPNSPTRTSITGPHRGLRGVSKFSEPSESDTVQKSEMLKLLGHSYGLWDGLMIGFKSSLA